MTDNTQELSEIIREMRYRVIEDNGLTVNGLTTIEQDTKQALLDWHNKQIEAVLESLIAQQWSFGENDDALAVPTRYIEAERNKLKERDDENIIHT